ARTFCRREHLADPVLPVTANIDMRDSIRQLVPFVGHKPALPGIIADPYHQQVLPRLEQARGDRIPPWRILISYIANLNSIQIRLVRIDDPPDKKPGLLTRHRRRDIDLPTEPNHSIQSLHPLIRPVTGQPERMPSFWNVGGIIPFYRPCR